MNSEQQHRQEMVAAAVIGDEAEKFLESDLGRTMLGMAEQEIKAAWEALENVSPSDSQQIERLQNNIWRARSFADWLRELVTNGRNAVEAYKKHESSD